MDKHLHQHKHCIPGSRSNSQDEKLESLGRAFRNRVERVSLFFSLALNLAVLLLLYRRSTGLGSSANLEGVEAPQHPDTSEYGTTPSILSRATEAEHLIRYPSGPNKIRSETLVANRCRK